MISIIISSINLDHLTAVRKNVEDTIGVPYEIIAIDNSKGVDGLCKVYNQGAKRARFEILCFMHEDIQIKTFGWGRNVIEHFNRDTNLGLIGIVGSTYKSSIISGYVPHVSTTRVDYANIVQSYKFKSAPSEHYYRNPENDFSVQVAVLDGVWLCSRKEAWQEFPFDEQLFKGFHCYDMDISLAIGQKYKVAVIYNVLLEHFSEGKFERIWLDETFKLHKKWSNFLPINHAGYTNQDIQFTEKRSYRYAVHELLSFDYNLTDILRALNYSNVLKLSLFLYVKLYLYAIRYSLLKRKK